MFWKQQSKPSFVYDQCVILDIDLDNSADPIHDIRALETELVSLLPDRSGIDGDEFSDEDCTVYIYGLNADEILGKIEHVLRQSELRPIKVTLQYGLPDNPETKEKQLTI